MTAASAFTKNKMEILSEFTNLLKFQSISTDPQYAEEVKKCAEWIKEKLQAIGMNVESWSFNQGHPCIYAENLNAGPDQPTLLLYNHYDVQPVDPLDLWDSPPFEPQIRDGEIYGRGTADNKGQFFYTYLAIKEIQEKKGVLPINIKWIIEGEEECGSSSLLKLLDTKKERLKADYLAIVDMGMFDLQVPQVNVGVRGIVTFEMELIGSKTDLHSGSHGGIVYNPNHALVEILSKLHKDDGSISVPGFYDQVDENPRAKDYVSFDFNEKLYTDTTGAEATGGERHYSPFERAWIRPTLEINGISGGYTGEGFKTVIPRIAKAKFSCRLVEGQDPKAISDKVISYIKALVPSGIECKITAEGWGEAVTANPNSAIVKAFIEAYSNVFGKPCGLTMDGGSIPVAAALNRAAESEIVLMGLTTPADLIHAPNEHFGVERLNLGMQIMIETLNKLKKE